MARAIEPIDRKQAWALLDGLDTVDGYKLAAATIWRIMQHGRYVELLPVYVPGAQLAIGGEMILNAAGRRSVRWNVRYIPLRTIAGCLPY